ncbi:acetyltransferase [Frondihabitans sp. PAMC 28766]|uniref:GNAT family N-acetyltransferase n=1 Tax=Frondihabitans sp. PAMC 28766 TaxID=1795630 RepID=UPI00078E4B15|nr:GNAT family N-acetyltransferase [Frondihabitans sp. PAMC 28766]AMM19152.1 acetyltransferase [Frondihabitans sp. PAMC 28766]
MPLPIALDAETTLRLLAVPDAESLAEAYVRNAEHLAPWDPARDDDFATALYQRGAIEKVLVAHEAGSAVPFAIDRGGEVVGRVDLTSIVRGPLQSAVLGYWLDASLTGHGLVSKAVDAVIAIARDELELHRLEAGTLLHNAPSQRVLAKAGFEAIGVAHRFLLIGGRWQDHILFQKILTD